MVAVVVALAVAVVVVVAVVAALAVVTAAARGEMGARRLCLRLWRCVSECSQGFC